MLVSSGRKADSCKKKKGGQESITRSEQLQKKKAEKNSGLQKYPDLCGRGL